MSLLLEEEELDEWVFLSSAIIFSAFKLPAPPWDEPFPSLCWNSWKKGAWLRGVRCASREIRKLLSVKCSTFDSCFDGLDSFYIVDSVSWEKLRDIAIEATSVRWPMWFWESNPSLCINLRARTLRATYLTNNCVFSLVINISIIQHLFNI